MMSLKTSFLTRVARQNRHNALASYYVANHELHQQLGSYCQTIAIWIKSCGRLSAVISIVRQLLNVVDRDMCHFTWRDQNI